MQVPGGTSGAAPLVAGVAAEMMLIDPALQQPANIVRVAEMIEATADDIGPAGVGCQTGHGRVNFWKAVLAATNGGLSAEGRTPLANGNDNFFKSLPLRDETHTTWYGFEVRTSVQNVALWLKWDGNRFTKVQDAGQTRPPITGANDADVVTYLSTQPYRTAGATPRPLPSVPFTQAELAGAGVTQRFLARFSIRRDQITGMTALVAAPLDKDPADDPESVIFELPIDDRLDLRRAQGASGDNADLIKALVQDFDDFVFHIDCDPVEQVRACLPDYHEWKVGDEANIPLELKNVGTSNIPVGRWIITGHEDVLAFDNVADFGPLNAGQTKEIPITMRCIAAGQATLHVTILRCANTDRRWVVSTKVGTGGNDSHDGHMTCSE